MAQDMLKVKVTLEGLFLLLQSSIQPNDRISLANHILFSPNETHNLPKDKIKKLIRGEGYSVVLY